MADDEQIGPHRIQRARRIVEVSPFFTEDCSTGSDTSDAPSRCAAVAKDIAVRVEFS